MDGGGGGGEVAGFVEEFVLVEGDEKFKFLFQENVNFKFHLLDTRVIKGIIRHFRVLANTPFVIPSFLPYILFYCHTGFRWYFDLG